MKLFEPARIGNVRLRSRLVLSPMGTRGDVDGGYDVRNIEYFRMRAQGGAGLIITGLNMVSERFETRANNALYTFFHADRLGILADKVHSEGAKLLVQIGPGLGRVYFTDPENPPYSASSCPTRNWPDRFCKPLAKDQIRYLVECMGKSALLAKKVGVDGVEVHAYGGYLIDQFLTREWNQRTDEYGGSLENRMRFLKECILEIRKTCGDDFCIAVKYTADHCMPENPNMRGLEEGVEIARELDKLPIDAIHVDIGCYERYYKQMTTVYDPPKFALYAAKAVKAVTSKVVIAQGKLGGPGVPDQVLGEGAMDLVAVGHQFLADPDYGVKMKEGRFDEIRHCIGCNECLYMSQRGHIRSCAVNPQCGQEIDFPITPAKEPRRVLVVGGGPGGMEAAVVAAQRGHKVELWERGNVLGGKLRAAGGPDFKADVYQYMEYAIRQVYSHDIQVTLGKTATVEDIVAGGYDHVVLATGADDFVPRIPGVDQDFVHKATEVLSARKRLHGNVVVIGGGHVGCEAALMEIESADSVSIIEMMPDIMMSMEQQISIMQHVHDLVAESGAAVHLNSRVVEIGDHCVVFEHDGERRSIPADAVILAVGFRSNDAMLEELELRLPSVRAIGDALSPRKVVSAVAEGFQYAITMR